MRFKFEDIEKDEAYRSGTSGYVINNAKKVYKNNTSSLWDKVKQVATTSAGRTNNYNNSMNAIRNINSQTKNEIMENKANQEYTNLKNLSNIQSSVKSYQQKQEEALKSTLAYKQAKLQNSNATEEELLKIAKNSSNELQTNLIKDMASKNGTERKTELKNISISDSNPLFYDNNKYRKLNNEVLQYKTATEAQEQANKINEDLKNGKVGSSVGHVLQALPTKAMEAVASPIYATGSLLNLKTPTGTADQDLKDWKTISSKYDQTTSNINNGLVRDASNVSGTIGYMIPSILASAIAPETNLGRIAQGVSVGGQSYIENLNEDASNKLKSVLTGVGKGTASYAIEGVSGGNILGKGSLDDLAVKTIASKTSNVASKKLASMVYEVGGEVLEEELENQVDYLIDKIVNDEGISLNEWLTEQKETVKSTIASTLVLKLLGLGGSTYKDVLEYEHNADAKKWINEAEKLIKKENLGIDVDRLKAKNNQTEVNNVLNTLENESNTSNLQPKSIQNEQNIPTKQVTSIENKMANNGNVEQNIENNLQKSYNDLKIGENTKVPIETILNIQDSSGGYRTQEQINNLRNDIITNGITTPIEIYRKNDGTFAIENGNHRIKIAQELGIKDIPVKLVESWESIGLPKENVSKIDSNKLEGKYNERDSRGISRTNENSWNRKGSMYNDNVQSQNSRTTEKNVELYEATSNSNEFTGSKGNKENNRSQGLEKSSSFNLPTKQDTQKNILPIKEETQINMPTTQGETINWNEIERPEGKIRKHYRSIIESNNTTKQAKTIAKELMGTDTYVPETNKGQLLQADNRINSSTPEVELKSLMSKAINGEKINSVDIAVGERLIQYYSKIGDKTNLQEAIQATAMAGTSAGQTVQALAMLNHQTPQGQATWIQRTVDKMNNELAKKKGGIITKDSDGNSNEFIQENMEQINEMPLRNSDKEVWNRLDNKRYVVEEKGYEFNGNNKKKSSSNTSKNNGLVLGGIDKNNVESVNNSGSFNLQENKQKYALPTKDWQQFVEDNYQKQGTGKNLKEYNLPIKEDIKQNEMKPYRTSEQLANDSKISDLDAIKEETKKIKIPEIDKVDKTQNELRKNSVENSPTIDYIKTKRSKEKVSIKEIKDTLAQRFVNKGHYIDKLANKKGNKNLTYLYDRTMNTFNESQISIGDYQINSKGEVVGKSIIDIFQPAQDMKLSKEFDDYLLNKHNISRYAHEKGIFGKEISATDSQNIINSYEKKYPQFKEWSKDVSKYNDNNIKDLVNNGLVSEETYKRLKEMYGDYVPTFRDITDNISQYEDDRVGGNALKKATESNLDILSVKESMAEQTLAIKKAIRINNLGIELYKTLGKDSTITTGIDFDAVAIQTIAGNVIDSEGKGKNTFTIFQDGEMTQFKISDELYSAFAKDTLQNKINNNKVAKAVLTPIEKMSKAQRELLTTYSVGFAMNNPIKDFQDALFNSKYSGTTFVKNWTKALYNIATDGSWYQSYKNNGGTANTYFDYNKGILPTKTKNPIKKFINKVKDLNEVLEQAPRLAEYISTIEHKGTVDEALYNAADITTNFKRGGDITKAINKYGANFLNASVQGLDKVYRNVSGKNGWKGYANLMIKATVYQIAPAIINGVLLGDDDDYDDLPDYTKDNYFLFKIGDGKFFRIPKGRLSSFIGGVARRALETAQGKEVEWKSAIDTAINQLAPNNPLTDNVVAPIKQAVDNKSWFDGDIVNTRLQKLPIAEQYDESTDKLSKFLGEYLKISPKKINYVLDQYSGGIGDVILPMMTPQAENNILEDKFTTDSVIKNKNVTKYYDEIEKLEKTKNSLDATDEDKLKYKYFTNSLSDISDLYKQKRDIQNSNISDKDKKEQVRNIQKQINDIVENKLSNVNKLNKNDKYATIDDSQYYKDIKENWNELSDEEKKKNKNSNISLKSYSDFKYQTGKLKQEKIDKGELKENEQLKDKDKIQILVDSNYSKDEKENIYKNYINSKDKKIIVVDKLGLPINEYLKYKTNTFENDKDKDGETVSGSKKKKVYNYLNSISDKNLSQNYKKIICKIEGINDYDNDIVNFVNSSKKLNYNERTEILKDIGFKIDKNGKIQTKSIVPIYKYVK